jgi:prepilin-type N-terminal cleavage/methylation domain-containing protein
LVFRFNRAAIRLDFKVMKQIEKQKGFTIIELLVCIGIMGVLAALMIANYGRSNKRSDFDKFYFSVVRLLHRAQQDSLAGDLGNAALSGGAWSYVVQYRPVGTNGVSQPGALYEKKVGFSKTSDQYSEVNLSTLTVPSQYYIYITLCDSAGGSCEVLSPASWHNIMFTVPYGKILMGSSSPNFGLKNIVTPFTSNFVGYVDVRDTDSTITRRINLNGVINRITP